MLSEWQLGLCALAAMGAGLVNAVAGGGTLITFPVLVAMGVPPIAANITNTVALCPGYLGATLAQWSLIRTQQTQLRMLLPVSLLGGVTGGVLLLHTGEHAFRSLIPYLILLACLLLALQEPLKSWLTRRQNDTPRKQGIPSWSAVAVGLAAVYGGYFGAGVSVIVLAVLGLFIDGSLVRANALKQFVSFAVNVAAASLFLFSDQVLWPVALTMAIGGLLGGALGGRLANHLRPSVLRWIVVSCGTLIGVSYFFK